MAILASGAMLSCRSMSGVPGFDMTNDAPVYVAGFFTQSTTEMARLPGRAAGLIAREALSGTAGLTGPIERSVSQAERSAAPATAIEAARTARRLESSDEIIVGVLLIYRAADRRCALVRSGLESA